MNHLQTAANEPRGQWVSGGVARITPRALYLVLAAAGRWVEAAEAARDYPGTPLQFEAPVDTVTRLGLYWMLTNRVPESAP